MKISPIIEIEDLIKIYNNSNVLIFDVSSSKNSKNNYEEKHLQGAFFVDLNTQLSDIKNDISVGGRHPLPTIESFAQTLSELGISNNNHIILYDDKNGSNASARFWWMLKSIGHDKVQVLNGGFQKAIENNFPLSSKRENKIRTSEPYHIDKWQLPIAGINEVESAIENTSCLIVDVRDKERYEGKIEPIDSIAGHIPGAVNIPFTENLDENGLFLTPIELRNKYNTLFKSFDAANIIVHCGSGVTACHTLLALDYAEMQIPRLYVGSWSEWSRNDKVIEKTVS